MGNQKETRKNPQYKYASTRENYVLELGQSVKMQFAI